MSGNELAALAVLIIFVVISIVSWVIKKFKGGNDNSGHEVRSMCGNCRKVVPGSYSVGDICPKCGVIFDTIVVVRPK